MRAYYSSRRIFSPAILLGLMLAVSAALAFLPAAKTERFRNVWREALLPGQQVLTNCVGWIQAGRDKFFAGNRIINQTEQSAQLVDRVRRLELELLVERSRSSGSVGDANTLSNSEVALAGYVANHSNPLLVSRTISARVLGSQAKAFLVERGILEIGSSSAARPNLLVVDADESFDSGSVLDQGSQVQIKSNQIVLVGRRVWGRIADVGRHTSTVRRINDVGYRDLVQLASVHEDRLNFSARGVLVGTGQRLCKIELVETTQPVTVGDFIFTADDGVLDSPLLYGRVTRLERKPGAAHWEIWMEPALTAANTPSRVAVLTMELNPARAAF